MRVVASLPANPNRDGALKIPIPAIVNISSYGVIDR